MTIAACRRVRLISSFRLSYNSCHMYAPFENVANELAPANTLCLWGGRSEFIRDINGIQSSIGTFF